MTKASRQERAAALESWADEVGETELVEADTGALRTIAALVAESESVQRAIREAVLRARARDCSWSQIGAMLGVSKQAAQQKFSSA